MLGIAAGPEGISLEQICSDAAVPDVGSVDISVRRKVAALPSGVEDELREVPSGSLMLDYGCGDGGVGVLIAGDHSFRLVQADIVDAREDGFKNGELMQISRGQTPAFPRGTFDLILLSDVLQYAPDKKALLKALCLGLTERGKIIVTGSSASTASARDVLQQVVVDDQDLEERVRVIV